MIIFHKFRPTKRISHVLFRRSETSPNVVNSTNRKLVLFTHLRREVTGVDTLRAVGDRLEDEQNRCLYPMLKQLGVTTDERTHSFSLSSDSVIKYIKLGAINRNLAVQYCHYLAHLCRHANPDDLEHYTARVDNLMRYILKQNKDLPPLVKIDLVVDFASTSDANCSVVCNELIDQLDLWPTIGTSTLTSLLMVCYKFRLWNSANQVLDKCCAKNLYWSAFDELITGMSKNLKEDSATQEEKQILLSHLQKLFKFTRERRIQFVTRQPELLVQCLESLMPDVYKRPTIKESGRCTHCNTHIPLYDRKAVSQINSSIKQVLDSQCLGNIQLYSNTSDIENFYKFLENLHKVDRKPIDCVIDGLNLAYKNSACYTVTKQLNAEVAKSFKRHDSRFQVQVLVNCMLRSNFLQKFRKILVIGKKHMKRWPGLLDFFEQNNIHFYASDNQAKDDLFMLYASTLSPKTVLVTNDFLRDHLALLDEESRIQLERYIDTHQMWIENKTLRAIHPTPFEKVAFANDSGDHFHIPVIDYNKIELLAQQEPPPHLNNKLTTWLCCSTTRQDTVHEEVSH